MMIQYDITKNDTWNFDEIDYCMSIVCFNWVVTVDSNRRIYFKNSNNKESDQQWNSSVCNADYKSTV